VKYIALTLAIAATGCASNSTITDDGRDGDRRDLIAQNNTELLRNIATSLDLLAKTKNAERVSQQNVEEMRKAEWMYQVTPQGLDVPISLEPWTGPLGPVVEMLADYVGYRVEQIGSPNGSERNVKVSSLGREVKDVLIDVATQAGCDAEVKPIGPSKVILIDWTYRMKNPRCAK
jgi:hypothetical protein